MARAGAEHGVGKEEGSGWTRGKESGPGSCWALGERKKGEMGWVAFGVWAGWGFYFLLLSFLFLFSFKLHTNTLNSKEF